VTTLGSPHWTSRAGGSRARARARRGIPRTARLLHASKPLRDDPGDLEFAGPTCNLPDIDLGSAAKTAAIHSIDCRCQTRIVIAARKNGVIRADVAVALSLSMMAKAVGFDRKIADVGIGGQELVGATAAGLAASISVWFLIRFFQTRNLLPFAIYCLAAGLISVLRFA